MQSFQLTPSDEPKITSPEAELTEKSFAVAQQKLEILMGDKFTEFAVRFVSLDEYVNYVDYHEKAGNYSFSFANKEKNTPTFKKWLEENKGNWIKGIEPTDWEFFSGITLRKYNFLIKKLREAHREASKLLQEEGRDMADIKNEVFRIFMQKIDPDDKEMKKIKERKLAENLPFEKYSGAAYNVVSHAPKRVKEMEEFVRDNLTQEQSEQILELLAQNPQLKKKTKLRKILNPLLEKWNIKKVTREEIVSYVQESREAPNFLLDFERKSDFIDLIRKNPELLGDENNLRKFFSTVPYLEKDVARANWYNRYQSFYYDTNKHQQYEIALIIPLDQTIKDDLSHIVGGRDKREFYPFKHYRLLKPWDEFEFKKILGAVVIIPDRTLVEKVIEHSIKAGETAHPVFTSGGIVAYPKK